MKKNVRLVLIFVLVVSFLSAGLGINVKFDIPDISESQCLTETIRSPVAESEKQNESDESVGETNESSENATESIGNHADNGIEENGLEENKNQEE